MIEYSPPLFVLLMIAGAVIGGLPAFIFGYCLGAGHYKRRS